MFLHESSSAPQQHKSVQYKLLALHLHRDVSHTDLLQLHFISCRRVSGAGGNVVIMGIYLSQYRLQPKLSGIGMLGLGSGADFQMMHWYCARLIPSRNAALEGGSFCDSACFLLNIHHLNSVSWTISVSGWYNLQTYSSSASTTVLSKGTEPRWKNASWIETSIAKCLSIRFLALSWHWTSYYQHLKVHGIRSEPWLGYHQWHIDIFNECSDLRNLMIYEQDCLRKCKISTLCNCLICVFLSVENKICSSAKLGLVLCISSYKTKYLG